MSSRFLLAEMRDARSHEEVIGGRRYLVVPVAAVVGGIVWRPMGSTGPEYVPEEVLAASAPNWDGVPVLYDHPTKEGAPVAAEQAQDMAFGFLRRPSYRAGKLRAEACLDIERAEEVGGDAEEVLNRARRNEVLEVSIGASVQMERRDGIAPGGDRYEFIYTEISRPDHLAIFVEATGACSVKDGCGTRAAKENRMSELEAVRAGLTLANVSGTSDEELRDALWNRLRAEEPAFEGIDRVYPDDKSVIYATSPEQELQWFRRSYEVDESGEISLAGDREQVEPVTKYEPVAAGCRCTKVAATTNPGDLPEGVSMSKTKEVVERLIAHERSPFTDDDREHLSAFSEERLAAMVSKCEEPEKATAPDPETVTLSKDEHKRLTAALAAVERQEAEKKAVLVSKLVASQKEFTEDELGEMGIGELERIARLAESIKPAKPDFSGRGFPVAAAKEDEYVIPDSYGLDSKEAN